MPTHDEPVGEPSGLPDRSASDGSHEPAPAAPSPVLGERSAAGSARTDRATAWRHLGSTLLATNVLVFVLSRAFSMRAGLHDLIGALFLVAALVAVRRDDDDTARYGVRLGGVFPGREGDARSLVRAVWESIPSALREVLVALGVAAVVLPVYALAWPLVNGPYPARHYALDAPHVRELATNLFAVALPEELFFRGYVLTRAADALGVSRETEHRTGLRALRAMAPAVLLSSALFALTHVVVEVTPARAAVFFPGLLFGALRVARGGVGAAVVLHALANVFELYLEGRSP